MQPQRDHPLLALMRLIEMPTVPAQADVRLPGPRTRPLSLQQVWPPNSVCDLRQLGTFSAGSDAKRAPAGCLTEVASSDLDSESVSARRLVFQGASARRLRFPFSFPGVGPL